MLASLSFAAAAALSFSATALAQGVCMSAPYNALTCLSSISEAAAACSDVPRQTKTVTLTTTTLDVVTSSITQMAASQNQITVQVTSSEDTTETVTKGPTETVTKTKMSKVTTCTTLTTYVPCSLLPTVKAAALVAEEPSCNADDALPALASLTSNDTLATACSCMGNPVPTYTTTETVNAPAVQATSTDVAGTPKTTTLYAITLVTYTTTVAPQTTVAVNATTTVLSTETLSLAQPTFSPVAGPHAGCANVGVGKSHALAGNCTTMPHAVEECKALCAQESSCKSLHVQYMFENWGGAQPHYVCEMNEKFLKPRRDLRCGKKESRFGVARGFDAKGRGV